MTPIQKHKLAFLYSVIFTLTFCIFVSPGQAAITADRSAAVIFVYQHIGDDEISRGNLTLEQFAEHVKEMTSDGYNVLPLPRIIEALKKGETLPQKTIGITFEGGWTSTFEKAIPLLEKAGLPYTVFFASDMADGGTASHTTWKQLKTLKKSKLASLGILPSAYVHMPEMTAAQNAEMVNKAVSRFREEFDEDPKFFAYPFGEYSSAIKKQIATYKFDAVFAQQSGVAYAGSDFLSLPRFTMTDNYGDLDRFLLTANALPLPVTDVIPDDMMVTQNPPMIGFTVTPEIQDLSKLACFVSGEGKTELAKLEGGRVEIRLSEPLSDSSVRINCTLPDDTVIPGEPQSWRWFGMQFVLPAYDSSGGDTDTDAQ